MWSDFLIFQTIVYTAIVGFFLLTLLLVSCFALGNIFRGKRFRRAFLFSHTMLVLVVVLLIRCINDALPNSLWVILLNLDFVLIPLNALFGGHFLGDLDALFYSSLVAGGAQWYCAGMLLDFLAEKLPVVFSANLPAWRSRMPKKMFILISVCGIVAVAAELLFFSRFPQKSAPLPWKPPEKPALVQISPTQYVSTSCVKSEISKQNYKELSANCTNEDLDALLNTYSDCVECYLAKAHHFDGFNAIVALNEAIDRFPDDLRLYSRRAELRMISFTNGDNRGLYEAVKDYSKLIEADPKDASARLNRCRASVLMRGSDKDTQSAITDCDYAINTASGIAAAYFFRGIANTQIDKSADAIEDLSRSIRLDSSAEYPDYEGTYYPVSYYRAKIYMNLKKFPEAANDYRNAAEKKPIAVIWEDLAYLDIKLGNKDGAKASLEKALSNEHPGSIRNNGLWASYYWVFEKNANKALEHLQKITADEGPHAGPWFKETEFKEFLSGLYETPEYTTLRKRDSGAFYTDENIVPATNIKAYKIDGACRKLDISSQPVDMGQMYFDFEVINPENKIRSNINACLPENMGRLIDFSMRDADGHTAFVAKDGWFWKVDKVRALIPKECGILQNPGTNNQLAIIKYEMDAVKPKDITDNSLLSMILLDDKFKPKKTLIQYLSNKSIYDDIREVGLIHICDIDSDGLVEVILQDSRYAGYGFIIEKFTADFTEVKPESVEGARGD